MLPDILVSRLRIQKSVPEISPNLHIDITVDVLDNCLLHYVIVPHVVASTLRSL